MAHFNGRSVGIKDTGKYISERIMDNRDFEKIVDTTSKWIKKRAGILERHFLDEAPSKEGINKYNAHGAFGAGVTLGAAIYEA